MKLLEKSAAQREKQIDQSREASEGLELARRVDDLRALGKKEESDLEAYRDKTLKEIATQIAAKEKEFGNLEKKIIPLRKEIAAGTKVLDDRQSALDVREQEIVQKEGRTARILKEATDKERRAMDHLEKAQRTEKLSELSRKDAQKDLTKAASVLLQQQALREEARTEKDEADKQHASRMKVLDKRDRALSERETMLEDREEAAEKATREAAAQQKRNQMERRILERYMKKHHLTL